MQQTLCEQKMLHLFPGPDDRSIRNMETIRIERITDPLTTGNCYILLENGHAVIIDPKRYCVSMRQNPTMCC